MRTICQDTGSSVADEHGCDRCDAQSSRGHKGCKCNDSCHLSGEKRCFQGCHPQPYCRELLSAFIRPDYGFNETCQDTVPQAIEAFLESESFEDAIRTAISVGGDSDTLAAITGSIAEAYYGIPKDLYDTAITYLDEPLKQILFAFESVFGSNLQAE